MVTPVVFWVLVALCSALLIVAGVLGYAVHTLLNQQKDLLDRLMARDWTAYATTPPRRAPAAAEPLARKASEPHSVLGGIC